MTRLMCSKDRSEVEWVRKELFKAGIPSVIRSNPLADALRFSRIELWVTNEQDYFSASKLYSRLHPIEKATTSDRASAPGKETSTGVVVSDLEVQASRGEPRSGPHLKSKSNGGARQQESEHASLPPQSEVEELLERQRTLSAECSSLRSEVKRLNEALACGQAELERERQLRAALETTIIEEIARLEASLDLGKHARPSAKGAQL